MMFFIHLLVKNFLKRIDNNISNNLIYSGSKKLLDKIEGLPIGYGKFSFVTHQNLFPCRKKFFLKLEDLKLMVWFIALEVVKLKYYILLINYMLIKDNLFPTPPIFKLIQNESKTNWREMYKVFNMGHRLEIYTNKNNAVKIIEYCK